MDVPSSPFFKNASIERTTLGEKVYEKLLDAIISGKLAPDTELSVVVLAKEMNVSRTPVHDSLRQLANDGLVVQEVNRKARVVGFTRQDIFEIFEMRKLLEGTAAKLAAVHINDSTVKHLQAVAERLVADRNATDWLRHWINYDDQFHQAIARASGNRRLYMEISRYRLLHRSFNRLSTTVGVLMQALAEHREILDNLAFRQPEPAAEAMVNHLEAWQKYFTERLAE